MTSASSRFFRIAGLALALTVTATSAHANCRLFQHRDYGGAGFTLRDGDRMKMVTGPGEDLRCSSSHGGSCGTTYFRPAWNDQISSFKLAPGCRLFLYQHVNKGGGRLIRDVSLLYVGSVWNDQASEAYCTCR